ncbi:Putative membrane protein%2C MmpL family [Mycobacteroides abscessus]|nr:Putative membrane protein%2C MmpL family [Mycobacteroides abscessus]
MRRLADLVVRWPWVVIGAWVALAIALPLTFPSLTEMAEKHPLAILPADAPSSVTAKKMTEAFHESSNDDLLLVVFINENGLGKDDADSYRKVVDALRHDLTNVVSVQDFIGTPELRKFLTSQDNKTWVLPVGLAGELGTPKAFESYNRVTSLIQHSIDGSPTTVHITGPAATVADLTVAGQQDRLPIEMAIAVLVLAVLLLVYRSALTMMLPLVTIGSSLVIAQSVVAAYSQLTGAGVSNQSIVFLSAILAGAGTDYAVFLISRYHDYLRSGKNCDQAVRAAMMSIGKVITASATTVGITFLLLSFAKMGVFQTVGVSSAIGIGVAYLSGMTLLPAILMLAGPRGWVKPRRELTAQFWRRSGIRIVRRPIPHLVASALVLALLGSCALLARYNYDDRKAVSPSAPSSVGYAALERHFPLSQSIPEYILIQSPRDLRTPQALADLEQMASRIAQLPDVGLVSGVTRPLGEVPPEFRATYQAGLVGTRLADGSNQINQRSSDLNRLTSGANTLAGSLTDLRNQLNKITPGLQSLLEASNSLKTKSGGDELVRNVDNAAKLVDEINALANDMGWNFSAAKDMFGWINPVLAALQGNPICDADTSCSNTRGQFERLVGERNSGRLDEIERLAHQLGNSPGNKATLSTTVTKLNASLLSVVNGLHAMGLDKPGGPQAGLNQLRQGADRLAGGSQQVAGGVDQLVGQIKVIVNGLNQASNFLLTMKTNAADPPRRASTFPPRC